MPDTTVNPRIDSGDPPGEDRRLVDLATAALVDPNLHTDLRMRLHREITELLRVTHEGAHGPAGREVHRRAREAHGDHLPDLLTAVLVDPNVHTDMRTRLHREIQEMLLAARDGGAHRERPGPRPGRQ